MKKLLVVLFALAAMISIAQQGGDNTKKALASFPAKAQDDNGSRSLSGSFVAFDPSMGGVPYYTPGATQDLVFRADSFTPDYGYAYTVWLEFPAGWIVNSATLVGTPTCDAGSWGEFSYVLIPPNTIRIDHARYMAPIDHCSAFYMVNVTAGAGTENAAISWYWDGDNYGAPPYHPCSDNGYTPAEMSGEPCDQMINPPAIVPLNEISCQTNSVFSMPPVGTTTAWINSIGFPQAIYDNFSGVTLPIGAIRFWLSNNGSSLVYPIQFRVEFYSNNAGNLGTQIASWNVNLSPSMMNINGLDVFDVNLPYPINLQEGWIGINIDDARFGLDNSQFGWADNVLGDGTIIASFDMVNYDIYTGDYNVSFCLSASPEFVPVANWALFIGIGLILVFAAFRFRRFL